MFRQEFGDFGVPTSDHMPVVVYDGPPRQTRTDRVGTDDREDSCGLDVLTYVTSGNDPRGPT